MYDHALLIGDALQKIKAAGIQEIIATNSIRASKLNNLELWQCEEKSSKLFNYDIIHRFSECEIKN
jgi:phosphoribosylpyrophosphate synthetase